MSLQKESADDCYGFRLEPLFNDGRSGGRYGEDHSIGRLQGGQGIFRLPIGMVKEIVRLPEITPVPDTPEFVEGVINLRGKIVPVIDMRKRLGAASIDYGRASRVLILELGGKIVGLIVDSASEILKISEEAVEPPPELVSSIGGDYITGVGKLNDKLIVMLDLTKLMSVEEIKRFDSMKKLRQGEDKALEEGGKALGEGNK